MNNDQTIHVHEGAAGTHEVIHTNGNGHDHHHHKQSFVSKYIFSQDHKTIAKQFLITGIIWAIIGALFSVLFRLQLGYPEETFPNMETYFRKWAEGGRINPDFY